MASIDVAILTALTEEFQALASALPPAREKSEGAAVWYRASVPSDTEASYEVVLSFQNEMGLLDAHDLTEKVLRRWEPAHVILVGIAGSFHRDVRLGDVVVSQQVFYFDPGRATPGRIQYRPQGYPSSGMLVRQFEALTLDKAAFKRWQDRMRESASCLARALGRTPALKDVRKALRGYAPTVHFGTMASGSLVIASARKQRELLRLHGKIMCTEMEGAGVLHATFREEMPTPAIVVKGISDSADSKKHEQDVKGVWRRLAAEGAARLTAECLRRGRLRSLHADEFEIDPNIGHVSDTRRVIPDVAIPGSSYLGFPRLVVPKGPMTELEIVVDMKGKEESLGLVKVVLLFADRAGEKRGEVLENKQCPVSIRLDQLLAPSPIGLYVLVDGAVAQANFVVMSGRSKQTATWRPRA